MTLSNGQVVPVSTGPMMSMGQMQANITDSSKQISAWKAVR